MTKEYVYLLFFIIFTVVAGNFILNGGYVGKDAACGAYQTQEISFGDKKVNVEISDIDCKRIAGLSGRKELKQDMGMLFIFDDEASHGIWMKDMNFPIDIVWLNSDEEIVAIKKNISPDTYPAVFGSDVSSRYVLEFPSGFADENNLQIGGKAPILRD